MLDGFEAVTVQTGEIEIVLRCSASGPPVLLLHGFPETHLMWRDVATPLTQHFTVVCADLRGYGRSGWHTHPVGQVLVVTAGLGWVQREGGPVEEIRPGDVVWIPPGVKHWHGAAAATGMTHIALQEHVDGRVVEWVEKVTDEQYRR